jgi:hypothetical protein
MFDRRKENVPIQTNNDRRAPILTENRMQLIWKIASQHYIDRLQRNGHQGNFSDSE